jgi:hypothetical protein
MRKAITAAIGVLLSLALAPSVVAGKKTVPPRIVQAQRVALGYDLGDRFVADGASAPEPGVGPQERRALQAVRDEIARWGRYTVVARPEEADLLLAIRLGRSATRSGGIGGGVSNGSGGLGGAFDSGAGMRRGSSYNTTDASNVDDVMVVYDCAEGRVGKRLWRASQADGLAGSAPPLVAKFRGDVERSPASGGHDAASPPQ